MIPLPDGAHVLVTAMKDEAVYVLEWVAHHQVLGFDAICVASNDCSDGTVALLDALADGGALLHAPQQMGAGAGAQQKGYALMRRRFGLDRAAWLMGLDVDEFLLVAPGGGRVRDLTALAPPEVDVIALSARTFGTGDADGWTPVRTCRRFTRRVPDGSRFNGPVKSLTRAPARFRAIHNHSMVGFAGPGPVQVLRGDGTRFATDPGQPEWRQLRHFEPARIGHALGHYNHYAIRSPGEFARRQARGLGVELARVREGQRVRHTEDYFRSRALAATIEDDEILTRYGAAVEVRMAQLLALPGVADAQARAERRMRKALAALGF